jgi:chromosomal replication initiation ATPase DnaA
MFMLQYFLIFLFLFMFILLFIFRSKNKKNLIINQYMSIALSSYRCVSSFTFINLLSKYDYKKYQKHYCQLTYYFNSVIYHFCKSRYYHAYHYRYDSDDIIKNVTKNNNGTNFTQSFNLNINTDDIFKSLESLYLYDNVKQKYISSPVDNLNMKFNYKKYINHNIKLNKYIGLIDTYINNLIESSDVLTLKIYIYGDYGCGKTFLCKHIKSLSQERINSSAINSSIFTHLCVNNYNAIINVKNVSRSTSLFDNFYNPTLHILELNDDLNIKNKDQMGFYNNVTNYNSSVKTIILVTSNRFIEKYSNRYDLIINVTKCSSIMIKKMLEHYYSVEIDDNIIFKDDVFTPRDVNNYCFDNSLDDSIQYFT